MDAKKRRAQPSSNLPVVAAARRGDADRWQSQPQHVFKPGEYCTDRYAVMRLLAAGGMAEIYEAFDRQTNEYRALKTLQLKHRHNRLLAKRAESEAKTLLEIRHPNLVRVLDAGLADGEIVFFVMELLEGCTLRALLDSHGPVPLALAVDLATQLATGVHALHTIGVIHRDLKPENAFVVRPEPGGTELRLKLLDLGAAKFEHRHHVTTSIHHTVGTLQYMSPEQSAGETKIGAGSDVYALALILFELAAGIHPARLLSQPPLTNGEWTGWHIYAAKPDLDVTLPHAPAALVRLLRAALHGDPTRRVPDAATFAHALAAIRRDLPGPVNDVSSLVWRTAEGGDRAPQLRLVLTSDVSPRVPFASTSETPLTPVPAEVPRRLEPRDTIRNIDGPAMDLPALAADSARDDAEAVALLRPDERPTLKMDPDRALAAAPSPRPRPAAAGSARRPPPPAELPRSVDRRAGPLRAPTAGRSTLGTVARATVAGLALAIVLLGLGAIGSRFLHREAPSDAPTSRAAEALPREAAGADIAVARPPVPMPSSAERPTALSESVSREAAGPPPLPSVTSPPPQATGPPPPTASTPRRLPAVPPPDKPDIWEREF